MKKIAVLFPGIGYSCAKPLLYYSAKLAKAAGYEIMPVPYSGFPNGVKGNREKMEQCFRLAYQQAEEMLRDVHWAEYDDILFLSKSVGTMVASAYAAAHKLSVHSILYTPLTDTFRFPQTDAIAFHGTADPWADTEAIQKVCSGLGVPLYLTENANHSLETGDPVADIAELGRVMTISGEFIHRSEKQ